MSPWGPGVVVCRETSSPHFAFIIVRAQGSGCARAPLGALLPAGLLSAALPRSADGRRDDERRRRRQRLELERCPGSEQQKEEDRPPSRAKRAYPIIEVREENGPAAPLLDRSIVISLVSETSTGDVLRRTVEKHVPGFHYVDGDVSSLTTGSGTSLGVEFLDEPIRSIAHVLAAGGWRLIAAIKRRSGDAFFPLPDKMAREVFGYVGEVFSLRACERCCKRFRKLLSDDRAWKDCRGSDGERGRSYREKAFISSVCEEIRKEQRFSRSIILYFLSLESIGRMVNGEFLSEAVGFDTHRMTSQIRGDALGYLLEVVENYMAGKLRASNVSALAASGRDIYPEVTKHLLDHVDNCHPYSGRRYVVNFLSNWRDCLEEVENEIDESKCFKLARRLAYKGGVVKITDEALKEVEDKTFLLMAYLLRKTLFHHKHITSYKKKTLQYESEESIDLWNDIPPILFDPNKVCCYDHVIVPGLIEDAASEIGFSCYGSNWVLAEGQTLEEAIAEATARYMVKGEYDWDTDDDYASLSSDNSDFKSLSDQSEDGDISEYDDEDCPDEGTDVE